MRFILGSVLGACALLVGCSSNGTIAATGDASVSPLDGSIADGSLPGPDASDAATTNPDAAKVDSGPGCDALGATADSCRSCCETNYGAGSKLFDQYTIVCACQASLCGPPDGGSPEAGDDAGGSDAASDAGAPASDGGFGQAACTASCNAVQQPDDACNACILATLGEVSSLGPCGATVVGQCLSEPTGVCSTYFGCVENCPVPQ